ncbi:DUF6542 domain-containing protein [Streptomyces sp. B6B3]|uniref:DUF6542 domain-containing protein n=1 Tax=Streptomyces sp. B6B3 TaxID=3153570 RepID=UPI00325DC98A
MEHSTRTSQRPQPPAAAARGTVPRPAERGSARQPRVEPRVRPGAPRTRARPHVRLTGFGCGALTGVVMVGAAWLCELFGGVPTLYGVVFLAVAVLAALWVRPADLICAPVAAPLAFALGLVTTDGVVGTVAELALRAPWLFAGTAAAAGLTLLRKLLLLLGALLRRRRRRRRAAATATTTAAAAA